MAQSWLTSCRYTLTVHCCTATPLRATHCVTADQLPVHSHCCPAAGALSLLPSCRCTLTVHCCTVHCFMLFALSLCTVVLPYALLHALCTLTVHSCALSIVTASQLPVYCTVTAPATAPATVHYKLSTV